MCNGGVGNYFRLKVIILLPRYSLICCLKKIGLTLHHYSLDLKSYLFKGERKVGMSEPCVGYLYGDQKVDKHIFCSLLVLLHHIILNDPRTYSVLSVNRIDVCVSAVLNRFLREFLSLQNSIFWDISESTLKTHFNIWAIFGTQNFVKWLMLNLTLNYSFSVSWTVWRSVSAIHGVCWSTWCGMAILQTSTPPYPPWRVTLCVVSKGNITTERDGCDLCEILIW